MRYLFAKSCAAIAGTAMLAGLATPAQAQIDLPSDVQQTCTVSPDTFTSWFLEGTPRANGPVRPADSVAFPEHNTVCDFYTWGAQMFLWLTSPDYNTGDPLVLDGPAVFTVLPVNHQGYRRLVDNAPDAGPLQLAVRSEKADEIGELGQAGGSGVLMSQNGSLVYYGVHVNDIYAYFLTGQKTGQFPRETKFPRDASDLQAVTDYTEAQFPAALVPAPEALVMELKTSWVAANTVDDPDRYVTIEAVVPTFDRGATEWTRDGSRTTELALVGMHVVGTVQHHQEFVWASFEHIDNAPNAPYYYTDSEGNLQIHRDPSDVGYQFMAAGDHMFRTRENVECMKEDQGNIVANRDDQGNLVCRNGIAPSNTMRMNPWGSAPDKSSAENNTLLLSINNSIRSQLKDGDRRANYVQIGGIWTSQGSDTKADAPIPDTADFSDTDLRGSLSLANATMETYNQDTSCFSCHQQSKSAPNSFQAFQLSHIYSQIVPLNVGLNDN
ncbi:hypothetical protein CKO28_21000 [Rhodovibrio sodomensis]|uniref:Cytochrome c family protein n=1 Tax=Rhodovibrio sodomensis TaxID=1088 RepID=A0ABS1DM98_9PROT|nr:hypothetical protein [Rhodovibrio sodomensis]MBK1670505.1 hypothetical protein [Rhodovibrio sodomensis]